MSAPVDRPLARAAAHFAAGRYPEAIGAYRAVLAINPDEVQAYVGVAHCAVAKGQPDAADLLIDAAQRLAEKGDRAPALALFGQALRTAPDRHEIHIDIAELEVEDGSIDAARSRLERLANAYRSCGREEEADAILEVVEQWNEPAEIDAQPEPTPWGTERGGTVVAPVPGAPEPKAVTGDTAVAPLPSPTPEPVVQTTANPPPKLTIGNRAAKRKLEAAPRPPAKPKAKTAVHQALNLGAPKKTVARAPRPKAAPKLKREDVPKPNLASPTAAPRRPTPATQPPQTPRPATAARPTANKGSLAERLRGRSGLGKASTRAAARNRAPTEEFDDEQTHLWVPPDL